MNEIDKSELASQEAKFLPDREAMSLISADPSQADAYAGAASGFADISSADTMDGTATGAAPNAQTLPATDAEGSASEGGSTTSEDRSEHITQSDSAHSVT